MEEGEEDEDDLDLARLDLLLQDYKLAKFHATRALNSYNLRPPNDETLAEQILAVAHVHISASIDHYSILQLGTVHANIYNPDLLFFNYRRLAQLLHPNSNKLPNASQAFELVSEAYSVLSDPQRKSVYDSMILDSAPSGRTTFWTVCMSCYNVHLYERVHVGKHLKCATCSNLFRADELKMDPPVVEGTDMYHCTWGFFPVGFKGGRKFEVIRQEEEEEEEEEVEEQQRRRKKVRRKLQMARKTVRTPPPRPILKSEDEKEEQGL